MHRNQRREEEIREIRISFPFLSQNRASLLIEAGKTRVLCCATVEDRVPPFLKNSGQGWISVEYAMLPGSCGKERVPRERQKLNGRVAEIERFISRALRMSFDLKKIAERTIIVDCDVLEADGSTRCIAFNGAMISVLLALKELVFVQKIEDMPDCRVFAAVSAGIVDGQIVVDLDYQEDCQAKIDLNIISDKKGNIAQVLALGEKECVSLDEFSQLIKAGISANQAILKIMANALKEERIEI